MIEIDKEKINRINHIYSSCDHRTPPSYINIQLSDQKALPHVSPVRK